MTYVEIYAYLPQVLTWRTANTALPFFGLMFSCYLMFTKTTCTKQKTVSSMVILLALTWLNLMWADFGSELFSPSRQSFTARIMLMCIMILMWLYLRGATISAAARNKEYNRVMQINKALMLQLKQQKELDR